MPSQQRPFAEARSPFLVLFLLYITARLLVLDDENWRSMNRLNSPFWRFLISYHPGRNTSRACSQAFVMFGLFLHRCVGHSTGDIVLRIPPPGSNEAIG